MGKGVKSSSKSSSHKNFKDKARNRVDDLEEVFKNLQFARKESRSGDVVVLEEQVQQMLREWKAELNEVTPCNSLLEEGKNSSHLSSDIQRLLQLYDEQDDATSKLDVVSSNPKLEELQGDFGQEIHDYHQVVDGHECTTSGGLIHTIDNSNIEAAGSGLDQFNFDMYQVFTNNQSIDFLVSGNHEIEGQMFDIPGVSPPPAAFKRPKCALWDCQRPAEVLEWSADYCSSFHAVLAANEGPPGTRPVLRPRGIELKDGPLFAAVCAKTEGKDVGIPECAGAATTKSPWNAPELFDLAILDGEMIREWLFFDKPRRAFENGTRKQRSLPDYDGRGWHESRKQVMKDFGGLKRSYYMDPQPPGQFEWHLFEYELSNIDACALYRLELKVIVGRNLKGKVAADSLVDLQQQLGRLSADFPVDNKKLAKGRTKSNPRASSRTGNANSHEIGSLMNAFDYGVDLQYGCYIDEMRGKHAP